MRKELQIASVALGDATLSNLPDLNILVGKYDLKEVRNIQVNDVIIQFGVKNIVREVVQPKRFALLPSKRKYTLLIEGSTGEYHRWRKLSGNDQFRVLKSSAD